MRLPKPLVACKGCEVMDTKKTFCTRECYDKYRTEKVKKACEWCKDSFEVKGSLAHQRFCSLLCSGRANYAKRTAHESRT